MKNRQDGIFRHELKFLISTGEQKMISAGLKYILSPDAHTRNGSYMIRSLYFDDRWESAYEEKLSGVESRKKYRIRIYDCSDEIIRLECKRKEGSYISKESAVLTREETERILGGDCYFLSKRKERLCQDFYFECVGNGMHPAVIVDYDREPYVYPYGDVRITFDSHVRAGLGMELFDPKLAVTEVMDGGGLIMEVKYTEYLPEIIRDILPAADSARVAYSKYTMCLEKKKELSLTEGSYK